MMAGGSDQQNEGGGEVPCDAARTRIADHIRWALREDRFELHYQDIRSITTGATTSREALLRWRDPADALPCGMQTLIKVAEHSDQISELGCWVLATACREAQTWPDNCRVTVNVSPRQLLCSRFAATALRILSATKLPPSRLGIEITETTALAVTPEVINQLTMLTGLGVSLALDDFGVGYSSLMNLQLLPFTKIKIDCCFVWKALHDEKSREIIAAIASLGKKLRMGVVAEGIETLDQLELLRTAGCDLAQGYLFSHPRPNRFVTEDIILSALRDKSDETSRRALSGLAQTP